MLSGHLVEERIFTWSPTLNRQSMAAFSALVARSISFQRMLAGVVLRLTSTMSSSHSMRPAASWPRLPGRLAFCSAPPTSRSPSVCASSSRLHLTGSLTVVVR
jgi:hypothetical protein